MPNYHVGFVGVEYTNMDVEVEAATLQEAIEKAIPIVKHGGADVFCHRGDNGKISLVTAYGHDTDESTDEGRVVDSDVWWESGANPVKHARRKA